MDLPAAVVSGFQLRRIDLSASPVTAELCWNGEWLQCHIHPRCVISPDALVVVPVGLSEVRRAVAQPPLPF